MAMARRMLMASAAAVLLSGAPVGAFAGPAADRLNAARAEAECRPGSRCYQRLVEREDVGVRAYREARRAARDIRRAAQAAPSYQGEIDVRVPQFRRGERFRIN